LSLGGRPKEEGGHKPLRISVNKFVRDGLKKVGNKSQFLEKVAQPVLEKMDPGEASFFLWQIDVYISQGIIKAAREENFKQVSALSWLANSLEDARKLCGTPPTGYKTGILETGFNGTMKEKFLEALGNVVEENIYGNPFKAWDLIFHLKSLAPQEFKERLNPFFVAAKKNYDKQMRYEYPLRKALFVKGNIVPFLLDKFSSLLYES